MRTHTIAFMLGILLLQLFHHLPSVYWLLLFALIIIFSEIYLVKKSKYIRLLSTMLLGFSWCLCYASYIANKPLFIEGKPTIITGYIASIPTITDYRTDFLFSNTSYGLLKLSWQTNHITLHVGDQWQFTVKLKKIHGTMNPGGFDYEAWAFQEGIRGSGYVITKAHNQLQSSHWYHDPLDRIREYLKNQIETHLPKSNTSPWIVALALGERVGISAENWQVLRNTGTNHLMAIAGLHIGFMAMFTMLFVTAIARYIPGLLSKIPAQHVGAIAALLMALLYSALAGFSIPTQRACIMLTVFLLMMLWRRRIPAWHGYCIALSSVLLINPLCVLTDSFWLSFGSVALIIYGVSARLKPTGLWWKLGRIQWVVALGLIPLGIWLFQQCSLVSFVANSIAIPWVGFLIVPLTLLGTLLLLMSIKLGSLVLLLADKLLSVLWSILTYLSHLSWASINLVIPQHEIILMACVGMILLLIPKGMPGRWLGCVWLLPLFFFKPSVPRPGEIWFTLLDVGQGLSAVVQTKNHVLVFDAGSRLNANFDMGASVVAPFLHSIGAKKIDMLVVSHGDNDHIGGTFALLESFPVLSIKTSVPQKFVKADYCLRGDKWQWDDVEFSFIYPVKENLNLDNDSSCVLSVTNHKRTILLTGDIEKLAEKFLVNTAPADLAANILVAPHHGSKTSGELAFLQAVHPDYVLFPIGYRNRYHFPHPSVVMKYQLLQTELLDTVNSGAIIFQGNELPKQYRVLHKYYWSTSTSNNLLLGSGSHHALVLHYK